MRHNMGSVDRFARIVAGVSLILFGLVIMHGFGVLYGVVTPVTLTGLALTAVGIAMFVTGLWGYCPLYKLFGINSCRTCRTGTGHTSSA